MKPPLRTKSVGTKVSEAEFALLEERARGAGMRLAEWVRVVLLSAPETGHPGSEPGAETGNEVVLAELLALRSLFLNLSFRVAKGEPVAEEEMRSLIERADATKTQRARERLEAAHADRRKPEPDTDTGTAAVEAGTEEG